VYVGIRVNGKRGERWQSPVEVREENAGVAHQHHRPEERLVVRRRAMKLRLSPRSRHAARSCVAVRRRRNSRRPGCCPQLPAMAAISRNARSSGMPASNGAGEAAAPGVVQRVAEGGRRQEVGRRSGVGGATAGVRMVKEFVGWNGEEARW